MTTVITNMFAKIKDNMYRKWLIQLNNSAFQKVYTFFSTCAKYELDFWR